MAFLFKFMAIFVDFSSQGNRKTLFYHEKPTVLTLFNMGGGNLFIYYFTFLHHLLDFFSVGENVRFLEVSLYFARKHKKNPTYLR